MAREPLSVELAIFRDCLTLQGALASGVVNEWIEITRL
jgi:hypothetical protein